jgi:hypothetical protein
MIRNRADPDDRLKHCQPTEAMHYPPVAEAKTLGSRSTEILKYFACHFRVVLQIQLCHRMLVGVIANVSCKGRNCGAWAVANELGVFGSDVNRLTLQ